VPPSARILRWHAHVHVSKSGNDFFCPSSTVAARRSPLAFRKGAERRRRRSGGFVSDPGPIDGFVPTYDAFDALLTRI